MATETFIDTSGFYSTLVRRDRKHRRAAEFMLHAAREHHRLVTTDYVLDESVTLLRARGHGRLVAPLFESIDASSALRIVWMSPDRFRATRVFCLQHSDKKWSFTDCFSFVVMRELDLCEALSSDDHYRQAGFRPLLSG